MRNVELAIIGGGPAGMAAACSAYEQGIRDIVIFEKEFELGGILQQCIHNGFGLHIFKEELTGPSFAQKYIDKIQEYGIETKLSTLVLDISDEKIIQYSNDIEGVQTIKAKAVIVATGSSERTAGAIGLPGSRPQGVMSAGMAQKYINRYGSLVGKKVFILGSGDIGLIMARRMTLEGAQVLGVAELMPNSNGLPRNIKQCLEDYNIPLYLSHTVSNVIGNENLEKIEISQVDEKFNAIPGTNKEFDVDVLLLSVGLIPDNKLLTDINVNLDESKRTIKVNELFTTNIDGVFTCGNSLHIHDLVDFVAKESEQAARGAYLYLNNMINDGKEINITPGENVGYVIPQGVNVNNIEKNIEVVFRAKKILENINIQVVVNNEVIKSKKLKEILPAEMESIKFNKDLLPENSDEIKVQIVSEEI